MTRPVRHLVDSLVHWSELRPDHRAYAFLGSGEVQQAWTFRELMDHVSSIAARLVDASRQGQRVLLLLEPGLDYVAAFLACLAARRVAVTAYAPSGDSGAEDARHARLAAIVADATPAVVLHASTHAYSVRALMTRTACHALCLPMDEARIHGALPVFALDDIAAGDLALLQYTSGSTSDPKGVMVSHGNLLHNSASIHQRFGHGPDSRVVSWLPLYHDMGLVGGMLQSLFGGFTSYLMSPTEFLQRPHRWLEAISMFKGTSAGGPNFGFQYCVDRIRPHHMEGWDLGSWAVAFNGAEVISSRTLAQFSDKFSPLGFRPSSFLPCYGLAEATLMACGRAAAQGALTRAFDPEAIKHDRAVPCDDPLARQLVSCGEVIDAQRLRIISTRTGRPCGQGEIGEICLSGPSVAQGYWRKPVDSEVVFGVQMPQEPGVRYMRTGDLGFIHEGELFVSGRTKDLIVIKGQNHHPSDIEHVLHDRQLVGGMFGVAAFSVAVAEEERLALAIEVNGKQRDPARLAELAALVREELMKAFKLSPYAVVFVRSGTLPRTSSGKIQRQRCKDGFGSWLRSQSEAESGVAARPGAPETLALAILGCAVVGRPLWIPRGTHQSKQG